MAKIESGDFTLKKILVTQGDSYYQIPNYQRPYQWDEEQCEQLLEDLFLSYETDKESDYFCGSLVLIRNSDNANVYDIVDGQQRLSTFILLAKVLLCLYNADLNDENKEYLQESLNDRHGAKKERLSFSLGFNSKEDFHDALKQIDNTEINDYKNNPYLRNAIFLKNYLSEQEIKDINNFVAWLYNKVVFIKIDCPNTDMALKIFNILNARGLPLSALDIFKAELLRQTKEDEQQEFVFKWNRLYQKCSENDLEIEKLFSLYLMYLNPVTSREKMDKRLATWFNKLNKTPLEYLGGVEKFLNAYLDILEMQDKYIYLLSYVVANSWHVILCACLLHHEKQLDELKELLVKLYYQDWIAGRTKTKSEQTCCNIIKALKNTKDLSEIKNIVIEYLNSNKVTQHFKENLKDPKLYEKLHDRKNSWLKPVLILVEYFISDNPNPNYIKMNSELHIEHVLPQNPKPLSQWIIDFNETDRERYTHSLANLTLLRSKKNKEVLNRDFKEKKEIYRGKTITLNNKKTFSVMTCYDIARYDVCGYEEWTPKTIQERERKLINIIESVLKF
ncbi:DUF262 domain-containing protein [Helicobacter cetorum]|uniref:DUF262 domain-containing protein n=1 Tax=Helicobacter cetorum TaxID=138563 RepID=UPI000CF0242B|nr:DUF262 domain-containing protein [Helicobacter cetorum]